MAGFYVLRLFIPFPLGESKPQASLPLHGLKESLHGILMQNEGGVYLAAMNDVYQVGVGH